MRPPEYFSKPLRHAALSPSNARSFPPRVYHTKSGPCAPNSSSAATARASPALNVVFGFLRDLVSDAHWQACVPPMARFLELTATPFFLKASSITLYVGPVSP